MEKEELEKLQADLAAALAAKDALQAQLDELKTSFETLKTEQETLKAERDELASYKQAIVDKEAEETKFATIKEKFVKAELEVGDQYFAEKRATLLAMDETALDFMIQELINMKKTVVASNKEVKIPNLFGNKNNINIKELAKQLRESEL